jgi:hypothetical protein
MKQILEDNPPPSSRFLSAMDLTDMIADRFGRVEERTILRRTRKTTFYSLGHIFIKTPSAPTRGFG